MGKMDIAFPHLGIYLEDVPQWFSLFGLDVAMYGVVLAIALAAGLVFADRVAKMNGENPDLYWDFAFYAVILSILGARLYYVIFEWDQFEGDLLSIFNLRTGGLAIYGGVITAFITVFVYAKIKKQNPFQMGDTGVFGLILGQVIGRWGNFFNREAFGQYTDSLFAMRLPVTSVRSHEITTEMADHVVDGINYIQVHPTFLYESAGNLLILILMLFYRKHKKFHGELCLFYLGGYGLLRFFVEGLRTDQLHIGETNIAVSQLLGILMFAGAVIVDIVVRFVKKTRCSAVPKDDN